MSKRGLLAAAMIVAMLPFGLAAQAAMISYVHVGDAGNAADDTGYGSVGVEYWIGKYHVTNSEYCEMLNAVAATDTHGLYNESMGTDATGGITRSGSSGSYTYQVKAGMADKPVNFVSWYDSLRFANWLHNGQPSGIQDPTTTEDGAYPFGGTTSVGPRRAGAVVWLPNENEWYKAAYYKAGGTTAGYWEYGSQSDAVPTAEAPPGGANSANYNNVVGTVTDVGAYSGSVSAYGAYDMNGNVFDWNETSPLGTDRGIRGGCYATDATYMPASYRHLYHSPTLELNVVGFRVASSVPEPATVCLMGLGLAVVPALRRKR